jgi:acyl carrier protein
MELTVRQVLADHGRLQVDPWSFDPDGNLYQCGLTSHGCLSVMLALEDAFDIEFPDQLLRKSTFESVTAIQGALAGLVGSLTV